VAGKISSPGHPTYQCPAQFVRVGSRDNIRRLNHDPGLLLVRARRILGVAV
jgi:hypothetical protein